MGAARRYLIYIKNLTFSKKIYIKILYLLIVKYLDTIKDLLDGPHRKSQRDEVVEFVGSDPKKMKALMSFFMDDKWHWRYNQRASWPVGFIGKKKPKLIKPYLRGMVKLLSNPSHDAVARNTVGIFQQMDIPEDIEGELYERCFEFLSDPKVAVAIRAFSITVLSKIAYKYEDLRAELLAEINEHLPFGTMAFKVRARNARNLLQ